MFFGFGTASKQFVLSEDRVLVATWSYFHIFLCPVAGRIHWLIMGNLRSEDREIDYEEVKRLVPLNTPSVSLWHKYGLYFVVMVGVALGVIHSFFPWEQFI